MVRRRFFFALPAAAVAVAALTGCAARRSTPPAPPSVSSARVTYSFRTDQGAWGEGRVEISGWDESVPTNTVAVPAMRFLFRLRNDTDAPLHLPLERISVQLRDSGSTPLAITTPAQSSDRTELAPKETRDIEVRVLLPPDIRPQDVRGVQVLWAVRSGGRTYGQATAFARRSDREGAPFEACDPWDAERFGAGRGGPSFGIGIGVGTTF